MKAPLSLEDSLKELRHSFDLSFSQAPPSDTDTEYWHGLVVTLVHKAYALPLTYLQEVLKVPHITKVPCASQAVRGMINLRGAIFSVLNTSHFLNLPVSETLPPQARILISKNCTFITGLLVDDIQGVIKINKKQLQPSSTRHNVTQSEYLAGKFYLEDDLVSILNVEALIESLV